MKPQVAITGATGFLGRHLVDLFCKMGWRVRILARRDPRFLSETNDPIDIVPGSLSNERALKALVDGVQVVIHNAGIIKAVRGSDFHRVNCEGSALFGAVVAQVAPMARFIFVSSMAARKPDLSPYAASKAAAEKVLRSKIENPVIIRPSAIYGPGDKETLILFKATKWPFQPVMNGKQARICMVHVHDVANAIFALSSTKTHLCQLSKPYEITDKCHQGYSWHALIEAAGAVRDAPVKPVKIPAPLVRLAGFLVGVQGQITRQPKMLTSHKVNEILCSDWSSSIDQCLPSDVWRPQVTLDEGLKNTMNWYLEQGWLPRKSAVRGGFCC